MANTIGFCSRCWARKDTTELGRFLRSPPEIHVSNPQFPTVFTERDTGKAIKTVHRECKTFQERKAKDLKKWIDDKKRQVARVLVKNRQQICDGMDPSPAVPRPFPASRMEKLLQATQSIKGYPSAFDLIFPVCNKFKDAVFDTMHLIPLGVVQRLCKGVHVDGTHNDSVSTFAAAPTAVLSNFPMDADPEGFEDIDSPAQQAHMLWEGLQQTGEISTDLEFFSPNQQTGRTIVSRNPAAKKSKVKNPIFRKAELDLLPPLIKSVSAICYISGPAFASPH